MSIRTYRAESVGQFDRPTGPVRERLLREQPAHDVFASAFTAEGCLTYGPTLTRFTVRHLLTVEAPCAVDADSEAVLEAQVRALTLLEELEAPVRGELATTLTCLEDLKRR